VGLAAALHDGTKPLHTDAERSGVMGALLRGQASRESYLCLVASLHVIYEALEASLDSAHAHAEATAILGPMHEPGFARRESLERDLTAALGPEWRALVSVPAEARAYAEHLRSLARERPALLLAHAWLRYLGDLNGGQIIARIVRGSPALATMPTHFYEFPALTDPRATAGAWRARLDTLPLSEGMQEALVAEAAEGFRRHIALFRAIADQGPAAPSGSAA
jgi:heme oxygenase (biliverdin-producing, ferredoxin)